MLDQIKAKLIELQTEDSACYGEKTIYGRVSMNNVPKSWNYITFNRKRIKRAGTSLADFNEEYQVNLVHEDYVPEEAVYEVISKLLEITGLKLAPDDIDFNYLLKNKTDTVVEVATIVFSHPVKGYKKR